MSRILVSKTVTSLLIFLYMCRFVAENLVSDMARFFLLLITFFPIYVSCMGFLAHSPNLLIFTNLTHCPGRLCRIGQQQGLSILVCHWLTFGVCPSFPCVLFNFGFYCSLMFLYFLLLRYSLYMGSRPCILIKISSFT